MLARDSAAQDFEARRPVDGVNPQAASIGDASARLARRVAPRQAGARRVPYDYQRPGG